MPTSVTGMRTETSKPCRFTAAHAMCRVGGFSLLELLLVLVIIGLIATMAGLSVSSGRRPYQIETAARQFVDIAEYAMDEAQLSGSDMGVLLDFDDTRDGTVYGYQWLQRADDTWRQAPFDEDAYGRRELPANVAVVLEIEEGTTELERRGAERQDGLPPTPQIVFYASGEAVPGIMTWMDPASGEVFWELEWDLLGRFEMHRRGIRDIDDES